MKILFIVMRFGKDGLATNILELARGLSQQGHEMHIVTGGYKTEKTVDATFFENLKQEFNTLGVQMHYVSSPTGNLVQKAFGTAKLVYETSRLIAHLKADVIHSHSPNLTFIPWMLGKKFVSTVHADTIKPNFRYKHPTLLIAVSQGSQEFTERVMHSPKDSIRMVYHGISERFATVIPLGEITKLKTENNIPLDKIIVGFVGRITPQKGTDVLVKAIGENLPSALREKIHIVLVGDYQTKNQELWLADLLKKYKLTAQMTILPFRDPKPYYQLFDVFVLPSRSDTFGLVAVEAMMSGCCTIRSNANGAYDMIEHGKNGLIFPMDDDKALAVLLESVLSDTQRRTTLATAGKENALAKFTTAKMIANTLKVYEELATI